VSRDHVDADELRSLLDPLGCDFAYVSDELHSERVDLFASLAGAHVARDHPLLTRVKCPVHRERQRKKGVRRSLVSFVLWCIQKDCVALDLDEPERRHRIDHRLEQTLRDVLRVREVDPVQTHELRIADDVCEEEKGALTGMQTKVRVTPAG
jgi:hypothetical protein